MHIDAHTCMRACAGAGAVQKVVRQDCKTVLVVGFLPPPVSPAERITFTLALVNGTMPSPCGDTFDGTSVTASAPVRYAAGSCLAAVHASSVYCHMACVSSGQETECRCQQGSPKA